MAYKIYFDVNVILDFTLQRSNNNDIEKIFNNIENGLQRGYITSATIHTVSYFLSKEYE
jgi:predicted nucleic acid-binding protein